MTLTPVPDQPDDSNVVPMMNNVELVATLRARTIKARGIVNARTWEENAARADELAAVPIRRLHDDDAALWHELEALSEYLNAYPSAEVFAKQGDHDRIMLKSARTWSAAFVAIVIVVAFLAFVAGRASATGFGLDVTFTATPACKEATTPGSYTLTATPTATAVPAEVWVWGDATDTADPTMVKVGNIGPGQPWTRTLLRRAGSWSGGVSLLYPTGARSNRSYQVFIDQCDGPIIEPDPTIVTAPTTSTSALTPISPPSTAQQMCEEVSPPMAGPCPTTTTNAPTLSTPDTSASPNAPVPTAGPTSTAATSPGDARVSGEVVSIGDTYPAGTPTGITSLPRTGAGSTIFWAALFVSAFGYLLVLTSRRRRAR